MTVHSFYNTIARAWNWEPPNTSILASGLKKHINAMFMRFGCI